MNEARSEVETALAGKRILLVEDMGLVAHVLVRMLEELQCEIIGPAGTFEAAMELVEEEPLDAVLLDLNLHGRSSIPVAEILRDRNIPVLLITGYGEEQLPEALLTYARLEKPFSEAELHRGIMAVLMR